MATKAKKNSPVQKGIKTLETQVKTINNNAIEFSAEMIDETVATGKEWQALLAKSLKGGVALYGKQQELVFDALESLKGQATTSVYRLRKLFNIDAAEKAVRRATKRAEDAIEDVIEDVMEEVNETAEAAKKTVAKARKTVKKATKKPAATAKKTVAKATTTAKKVATKATTTAKKTVVTAQKEVAATAKTTVKKAAAVKATAVKVEVKSNLKTIEGIGPKIEEHLNKAGIQTFKQLAEAKQETLKDILAAAGPRYKMHDPTTWTAQAALAVAGNKAELAKLQDELKGGRIAK
ncbi:MAG: helix-hairpin-helix domain-containing protein [Bacteroidota bacterium]